MGRSGPIEATAPAARGIGQGGIEEYPRTPEARLESQRVADTLDEITSKDKRQAVQIFTHENGSVSVGFSGKDGSKGFPDTAKRLEARLNEGLSVKKYTVAETSMPTGDLVEVSGGNIVGVCAEPHAAEAARGNFSLISGADTRWRGRGDNQNKFTGNNSDGVPAESTQMNPCRTCQNPINSRAYRNYAERK